MSEKIIAEALGLKPLEDVMKDNVDKQVPVIVDDVDVPILPSVTSHEEVIDDIDTAKENIATILKKGADSLDELLELAKQSQSPRAFEVVSTMMKTLLDANKEFVGMSEKKKFAKEDHPAQQATTNVTNNNLILSTTDMLKMLKGDN